MSLDDQPYIGKNVVIFGASLSGTSALETLGKQVNVVAFIDNDINKIDTFLHDYPIRSPEWLRGASSQYDYILIASEYFEQIQRQLEQELDLSPSNIIVLSTSIIKPFNFGSNDKIEKLALKVLFRVSDELKKAQVLHYIDAGTLLGIYRDRALIPWDDDLDIAIDSRNVSQAITALTFCVKDIEALTSASWKVDVLYAQRSFGAVRVGDIRGVKLRPASESAKFPMLDLFVKYINDDVMDYVLSSRGIQMPSYHLLQPDPFEFMEHELFFPSEVEKYLEAHYGDWKTPAKEWNLSMLENATVF